VSGAVQLPLLAVDAELPFDPHELAVLTTPERGRLYADAGLDDLQIACCEDACRAVVAGRYGEAGR
jgi:hypothetical protein